MRSFVLVDGRSGAGKTTYAQRLSEATGIPVVHLEDFYPGWSGLRQASQMVADDVLHPTHPGFRRWDWDANRPGEWVELDPASDYIIEGVGALTQRNIDAARALGEVRTVRLVAEEQTRKRRALTRDPYYRDYWEQWAQQERAFFAAEGRVPADDIVYVSAGDEGEVEPPAGMSAGASAQKSS
ncbi:nucleoside/nucleotide kinase family protein [Corynebacterium uterequi]|uniref:Adenylate kinase-like kinase n=1 Tax=Corynebacterium uterequi TaxID=1072256 RepID=A0A0G3HI54_9CORY|nr:hypothetical protein [Corynebacterium uterequi]AKK10812.1 adenylate kinase-like kinase [Corynebacterium uterequi]